MLELFCNDVPELFAEIEYSKTQVVCSAGVAAPTAFGRASCNTRHGIILEHLHGSTILSEIVRRSGDLIELAELFAASHAAIHSCETENLPSQRDELQRILEMSPNIENARRASALSQLAELPVGTAVGHGDFHPGNLLICEEGTRTVDWLDAVYGCPLGDVARTLLMIRYAKPSQVAPALLATVDAARGHIEAAYRTAYRRFTGCDEAVIDGWVDLLESFKDVEG